MTDAEIAMIHISDPEIATFRFAHVDAARAMMRDHITRRLTAAIHAVAGGHLDYAERGTP
ncbi:MAG: hypothetical protein ACT4NP_08300 [Pseudonocardiales bacterium]